MVLDETQINCKALRLLTDLLTDATWHCPQEGDSIELSSFTQPREPRSWK